MRSLVKKQPQRRNAGIAGTADGGLRVRRKAGWATVCDGRVWAGLADDSDQNWFGRPRDVQRGFKGRLHGGFVALHERFRGCDPSIVVALARGPEAYAVDRRGCLHGGYNVGAQSGIETLGQTCRIFDYGERVRHADEALVKNHVALENVVVGIDS
jgi:hypothetical protein